ncbi:MAG: methyltransferase [Solirubrobacteraceae bacterium]|nr:methyltransferase [Solirubrobacteraceae bacterium]
MLDDAVLLPSRPGTLDLAPPTAARLHVLPGVYRPAEDTWLLARALEREALDGADVLDLCTGSGAIAVAAAGAGARVSAVDLSRRAVLCARLNLRRRGARGRVRRGRLFDAAPRGPFDVITANPPYVPTGSRGGPPRGRSRAWDAGRDGRDVLDRICDEAPGRLRPGGRLLVVQSALADASRTVARLRRAGLDASIDARARIPFGPVLREREATLRRCGLLDPHERDEEIVVVRGRRPGPADGGSGGR